MPSWAVVFFIIAITAGVIEFVGIAVASSQIAQFLFFLFVVPFVAPLLFGVLRGRPPPAP